MWSDPLINREQNPYYMRQMADARLPVDNDMLQIGSFMVFDFMSR